MPSPAPFPLILFDDQLGQLSPLDDLRPIFAIRTGALTTAQRLARGLGREIASIQLHADDGPFASAVSPDYPVAVPPPLGQTLIVNSRCPLAYPLIGQLEPGESLLEEGTNHVVAAVAPASQLGDQLEKLRVRARLPAPALLSRPWHIKTFRDRCLAVDLDLLVERIGATLPPAAPSAIGFGACPFALHPTARLYPGVVLDLEHGPIVIDEGAVIRPAATIIGPAYIGPHSTVLDRAIIKGGTAIGPHCKVAGEIGGTIFQGFANKAHDGHLGDSWVGEWANLGAGSTNSNLLNTYAEVTARTLGKDGRPGPIERTGEQFLGAVVGDHVKTAICTRIMTGAVIGTGTMWAATAPTTGTVERFTWATDAGTRRFATQKFIEVMKTVMARRKMQPGDAYVTRLTELSRE